MIQSIEEYKYEYPRQFVEYAKKNKIDNLIPPEQKSLTATLKCIPAYANAIRRTINGETPVKIINFELTNFKCDGVQGNKELIPIEIQRRFNNIVIDQSIDIKSSFSIHVSNNTDSTKPVYSSSIVLDRKKDTKYFSDNCKLFDLPQFSDVHIDNITIEENTALESDNMCHSFNGKVGYEMVNKDEFKLHIKRQEYCDPMYILLKGFKTLNDKFKRYIDIITNDEDSKELEINDFKLSNINYLSFKFNGESETMSYLLFNYCYNVDKSTIIKQPNKHNTHKYVTLLLLHSDPKNIMLSALKILYKLTSDDISYIESQKTKTPKTKGGFVYDKYDVKKYENTKIRHINKFNNFKKSDNKNTIYEDLWSIREKHIASDKTSNSKSSNNKSSNNKSSNNKWSKTADIKYKYDKNIIKYFDKLHNNSTHLDYGSGDGAISKYILNKNKNNRSYSIDIKDYRSDDLKNNKNNMFIENVSINTINNEIKNNTVDLITALNSLHHIEFKNMEHDEIIDNIIDSFYRILKPGGLLLIKEHNATSMDDLYPIIYQHMMYHILFECKDINSIEDVKNIVDNYHITDKAWYMSKKYLHNKLINKGFKLLYNKDKNNETKIYNSLFIKPDEDSNTIIKNCMPDYKNTNKKNIKTVESSRYSITIKKDSETIIKELTINKPLNEVRITDATANIGGNTLQFGIHGMIVDAYEIDKDTFDALNHNIGVYGLNNIKTYNEDYTKIYKNKKQDVVFLDPPWGGSDYKKYDKLKLKLSGIDVVDIINYIINKDLASVVILKAPFNFDKKRLMNIYKTIKLKKYNVFYIKK